MNGRAWHRPGESVVLLADGRAMLGPRLLPADWTVRRVSRCWLPSCGRPTRLRVAHPERRGGWAVYCSPDCLAEHQRIFETIDKAARRTAAERVAPEVPFPDLTELL